MLPDILMHLLGIKYEKFGYTLYAVEIKDTGEFIGFVGLSHPQFEIPHSKLEKNSPLSRHVLYRLTQNEYNAKNKSY